MSWIRGGLLRSVCVGTALLALAGCASDGVGVSSPRSMKKTFKDVPPSVKKLAVLPFKAPTEHVGISISDLFTAELYKSGRFTLVERSQMDGVLGESEFALMGVTDAQAAQVGQMLGADAVLVGTVLEYDNVAQRGHVYPSVGISARIVDSSNGKILWIGDAAGRATSKSMTLSQQAKAIVVQICTGSRMSGYGGGSGIAIGF